MHVSFQESARDAGLEVFFYHFDNCHRHSEGARDAIVWCLKRVFLPSQSELQALKPLTHCDQMFGAFRISTFLP